MVKEYMRRHLQRLIDHQKRKMEKLAIAQSDEYYIEFLIYDVLEYVRECLNSASEFSNPSDRGV